MENLTSSKSASDLTKDSPCAYLCGMCPTCVFAKSPAVSTERVWTVGDSFQRRFMMDLLCRCRSMRVLEKIQRALHVTTWTLFSYSTSNAPVSKPQEKPLGFNGHEIREWFDNSPDWMKSHYLCRLLLSCDTGLLRALANLTSVLLIRQNRGLQTFEGCETNGESEEPALMVVPGLSMSFSGISRYKDFISALPVTLAKKILGFLDESSLQGCGEVCRRWQLLAEETHSEIEFRKRFNEKTVDILKSKDSTFVSPTYANIVQVLVPCSQKDKEDHLEMKAVQMEERNVYCGGFVTTDVITKRDPHRVVDYRGKKLMALGSKDGVVHLVYIFVKPKVISVLKSNVLHIRAVLLCEELNMVITGNYDAIIRCWNLKSEKCGLTLFGHTGPVNCLDVCGERLVSGAKDCAVKIWSLLKGTRCEEYNFRHPSSVQCVKINKTRVCSSCDTGLVKIWNLEKACVHKVIDAHQSSVRCFFFNEWHLVTGDVRGLVMVWSTDCEAKDCLNMFSHPKEVKSLTLTYLRVVTACADGKIRIFNFLTGECLRVITVGSKTNILRSVHFHESRIIVNSVANVMEYYFGHVFWEYADSANKDKKHVKTEGDMSLDTSKPPPASATTHRVTQVALSSGETHGRRKSLPSLIGCRSRIPTQEQRDLVKVSLSEKAASERIQKRGPHHALTRDSICLKLNTLQRAQCMDEAGVNMEHNAKLTDDWGTSSLSADTLHTVAPKVMSTQASKSALKRMVSTAPGGHIRRPHPPLVQKVQSQSAKTHRLVHKGAKDVTKDPQNMLEKSLSDLESFMKSGKNVTSVDVFKDQTKFKLFTTMQLEEYVQTQRDLMTKNGQKEKKGKQLC